MTLGDLIKYAIETSMPLSANLYIDKSNGRYCKIQVVQAWHIATPEVGKHVDSIECKPSERSLVLK